MATKMGDKELEAACAGKKKSPKPDSFIPDSHLYEVVDDYACVLNQTNIASNNNKFYMIQVLKKAGEYYTWNRWGRVGQDGQNKLTELMTKDAAVKDFEKKFKDKTSNEWANRDSFNPTPGKYTLIDMANDEDEDDAPVVDTTQKLENLSLNSDGNMPLGKLSKAQRDKGFKVLEEIRHELKETEDKLRRMSSRFYTLIPHDCGRKAPPTIADLETLQKKMDMLAPVVDTTQKLENLSLNSDGNMPLGKLSKAQRDKGFKVLEEIRHELKETEDKLRRMSSRFYTLIPHDCGRKAPPTIADLETLQKKMDMLAPVGDTKGRKVEESTPDDSAPL